MKNLLTFLSILLITPITYAEIESTDDVYYEYLAKPSAAGFLVGSSCGLKNGYITKEEYRKNLETFEFAEFLADKNVQNAAKFLEKKMSKDCKNADEVINKNKMRLFKILKLKLPIQN